MTASDEKSAPTRIELNWTKDLLFQAVNPSGLSVELDGDSKQSFSPMEGLLSSLCGCIAIDVVLILTRMRLDLKSFSVSARGWRKDDPPRYFRKAHLEFRIQGDVPEDKAARAIQLSFEKYCSVLHSLRPDLELSHGATITR